MWCKLTKRGLVLCEASSPSGPICYLSIVPVVSHYQWDDGVETSTFDEVAWEWEGLPDSPDYMQLMIDWGYDPNSVIEFFNVPQRAYELLQRGEKNEFANF